ncbi:MFS general substrate transporter [Atractiella rhizophila]|nr:MFS general substrate transporter [Atractiella rhizophila]
MEVPILVFLSLLLDLLAFTIPLPLFPRLIEGFILQEIKDGKGRQKGVKREVGAQPNTILVFLLNQVGAFRSTLLSFRSPSTPQSAPILTTAHAQDVVLLGGLMGSLFSFCQFIISPFLGRLSDRFGRKPVLLATMLGNIASAVVWVFSTNFETYLLSRIIGGLSEGNVQLSVAIISDVVSPARRARSLALIGLAFSIAFTIGPSLGAWLSKKNFYKPSYYYLNPNFATTRMPRLPEPGRQEYKGFSLNIYAVPALITLVLLVVETLGIALWLPETRWTKKETKKEDADEKKEVRTDRKTAVERRARLKVLERQHAGFLFFFSGAEYTLTFLTFDIFNYSNVQNGMLLGFIGILSALLQGGYVRRVTKNNPEASFTLARNGITACFLSLLLLTLLPYFSIADEDRYQLHGQFINPVATLLLYSSAVGLAFTSATVVNSLTSLASVQTDEEDDTSVKGEDKLPRGLWLGRFRSAGQLGRALGPIVATSCYFIGGPIMCYLFTAAGVGAVWFSWERRREKIKTD